MSFHKQRNLAPLQQYLITDLFPAGFIGRTVSRYRLPASRPDLLRRDRLLHARQPVLSAAGKNREP